MTASQWGRVKEILCDALEIDDPEQRAQYVERLCLGNPALLEDVNRVVAGHEHAGSSFLSTGSPALVHQPDDVPNIAFGSRYEVQRVLGRGGVSIVYLAHDRHMAMRPVVLKTLNHRSAQNPWIRSKFRHEMEALARIRHPGVVQAIDFVESGDGTSFLVMEYVEGRSLREEVAGGPMPFDRAEHLLSEIGSALAEAHAKGVQHRDLKPENVVLRESPDGEVATLIDFGIAKVESPEHAMVTDTVVLAGTTSYMAPEQLLGSSVPATDQYALAVMAFEMLTGKRPYYPATPVQLFDLQKGAAPPDARQQRPDLPDAASRAIRKAMRFDAAKRYGSVREFVDDLCAALRGEVTTIQSAARRRWLVGVAAGAPAILLGWTGRERIEDAIDSRREVPRVVEWDGTREPAESGFALRHDLRSQWEPNADRNGYRGLRMFSNSQGVYISYLTRAQKKAAVARGWRMSFSCIAIEGVTFSILDLVPYRKRFDLYVVSRQGSQVLLLHSRYKPQFAGEEYSIEGAPGTAHTYEMVAAAGSATVRVSVDGKKLASSYAGQPDYQEDKNVVFGVAQYKSEKAEGIIRSVRFEILG